MTIAAQLVPTPLRQLRIVAGVLALCIVASAHVGNPDAVYEGQAGPYAVRVIVRSPVVIPQRAEVVVRLLAGTGVQRVRASARFWDTGEQGAPPPDEAKRVPGDSTLWTVQLWLMRQGSYAISVFVDGTEGKGMVLVPVTATAQVVKPMGASLGITLIALVGILIAGILAIVRAATAEAPLDGGVEPDERLRRASVRARLYAGGVILASLIGYAIWWRAVDQQQRRLLFRPTPMTVTTRHDSGGSILRVSFTAAEPQRKSKALARNDDGANDDGPAERTTPLIPDHGKLMHLFVVRADRGYLAHLHPLRIDSTAFEASLPPLDAGRYFFFADVLQESGFQQTLVASSALDAVHSAWTPTDPDDASHDAREGVGLPDGARLTWSGDAPSFVARRDVTLSFMLRDASGTEVAVEPYLGMAGHAVVVRAGGDVFAHIHPSGTISMDAQRVLTAPGTDVKATMPAMTSPTLPGRFSFPFAFPKGGEYSVWVQFRYAGAVRTVPFVTMVKER